MTEITKSIFREYDIRGIYPIEINEEVIIQIAKAISIKCNSENVSEICIGRDGRNSSKSLSHYLEKSLSILASMLKILGLLQLHYYILLPKKLNLKVV